MKRKKDKVKSFYCLDLSCCLYLIPTTTSIHTMMSDQYLTCPYFFYSEYMDGTLCGFYDCGVDHDSLFYSNK